MTQQRMFPDEQGASIIQGTHRPLREQYGVWDENLAPSSQVAPPSFRIARASLPVQEQRRRQQPPSQHGACQWVGHISERKTGADEYAAHIYQAGQS